MAEEDKPARDDYDSPWKEAMVEFLPEFFEFFFPWIGKEVDWSKPPVFLDAQLRQMEKEANLGKREADSLIKVWRLNGKEAWVLVHVEVQAQRDPEFPLRMFISHYRIFDLFHKPVCSLAIFADKSKNWRPSSFSSELWGTTVSLQFSIRKLQDYNHPEKLAEFERSTNLFAHLVAATLCAQATRPTSKARAQRKFRLVRNLYELGLGKEKIRRFFKFIDWVLTLSPDLTTTFNYKMQQFEQENNMPYITSIERLGLEKGLEKGRKEGRKDVARRMLARGADRAFILEVTEVSEKELADLENELKAKQEPDSP